MSVENLLLSSMDSRPHTGFCNLLILFMMDFFGNKIISQVSLLVLIPNVKTTIIQKKDMFSSN